mgnify:CR=1 FL=1
MITTEPLRFRIFLVSWQLISQPDIDQSTLGERILILLCTIRKITARLFFSGGESWITFPNVFGMEDYDNDTSLDYHGNKI